MSKLPEKKKKKKVKKLNKGAFYDAIDVPFNAYIRNRDKNRCVICGSTDEPQCGHLIPKKSHINIRWDEENAFCQCRSHNILHNYDPSIYINWHLTRYPGMYQTLFLRSQVLKPTIDYRGVFHYWLMKCASINFNIQSFILNSPYYKLKVKKVFPDIIEEWQKGN